MKFLLDELAARQRGGESVYALSALQRSYTCRCRRAIFFRNSQCLYCLSPLGYEPRLGRVFPLQTAAQYDSLSNLWQLTGPDVPPHHQDLYRRCANLNSAAACNWLIKVYAPGTASQSFCKSCRLNRTVPDLSNPENGILWRHIEMAKRHVISALIALGLPVSSRVNEDPHLGLAFDFLRSPVNGPRVLTGHNNGIITINIEEADDVKREQTRTSMHEPYRTLVGHFRHEVGHHYWDRLIAHSHWLEHFRTLFGDERQGYNKALQRNYRDGPDPGWQQHCVSAYASVHPWEDWAETWAHYLHMVDALGTALSFGIKPEVMSMPFDCFGPESLWPKTLANAASSTSRPADADRFLSFLNAWLKLTAVMNELCRSMGQADFYPFALAVPAVTKLHFVHLVVSEVSNR